MPELLFTLLRRFGPLLVCVCLCIALPVYVLGQDSSFRPFQAFPTLFPRYTGVNGYEDLVMASDLFAASEKVRATEQNQPTLSMMRAALSDPNVAHGLAMIRAGLDKPTNPPRDPSKMDEQTKYPEYAGFRRAARVLAMEEYVALADGQVSQAIGIMRDGLRLGYLIQSENLIGGLVGIAVDSIVLEQMARHFEQMALKDCIQVTAIAAEWLKLPPTIEKALSFQQQAFHNTIAACKNDPERLRALLTGMLPDGDATSEPDLAAIELSQFVSSNATGVGPLLSQAISLSDLEHQALVVEIRKPAWLRKSIPKFEARATMAHRLAALVNPPYVQALARFDIEKAKINLMGVHGLIRRFQWEHNRLPDGLAELMRPDLTVDPFTGEPFVYKRQGQAYDLSSAGAQTRNSDASGMTADMGPITLPKADHAGMKATDRIGSVP